MGQIGLTTLNDFELLQLGVFVNFLWI